MWDQFWGYLAKGNIAPVMIGEFGSKLQTTSDQQWFQAITAYIKQNSSRSGRSGRSTPNFGDTGGLLADDWQTVVQAKQTALQPLQYPFIGTGSFSAPTSTPTSSTSGGKLLLDGFEFRQHLALDGLQRRGLHY